MAFAIGIGVGVPFVSSLGGASGLNGANTLLRNETDGIAVDFRDNSMVIKDTVTPANNYNGTATGKLTFVRASLATYCNSSGSIVDAASGAMRFDFDPITHLPLGILVEEARTNILPNNSDMSMTFWTKTGATVSTVATTNPGPVITTAKLIPDISQVGILTYPVTPALGAYTFSAYFKAAGKIVAQLGISANWFIDAVQRNCQFNLDTGTIGTANGAGIITAMAPVGDDWYRCSITVICDKVTAGSIVIQNIGLSPGDGINGFYIWGAQLEAGAFATSLIQTTGVSATRALDSVFMATSAGPALSTLVSMYANYATKNAVANRSPLSLDDGTSTNFHRMYQVGTAGTSQVGVASVLQANIAATVGAVGTFNKVASASAANDFAIVGNGGTPVADLAGTMPPAMTTIRIGQTFGTWLLNGWVDEVMLLPRRMTNLELQKITGLTLSSSQEMLLTEPSGIAWDWLSNDMTIIDLVTPANNYNGPIVGGGKLTFTRASAATYVGIDGYILPSSANSPRLSYDPTLHTSMGLLVEPSVTNLIYNSHAQGAIPGNWWGVDEGTISKSGIGPTGVINDAVKVVENTNPGFHDVWNTSASLGTGTSSFSVFIKSGSGDRVFDIGVYNFTTGTDGCAVGISEDLTQILTEYDYTGGSFIKVVVGSTRIVKYADGWNRVSFQLTSSSSLALGNCSVYIALSKRTFDGSIYTGNYVGNGTSHAYVYGLQLEASPVATSFIETLLAATATRAAEVANQSTTLGPISYTASTAYAEAFGYVPLGVNNLSLILRDGAYTQRWQFLVQLNSSSKAYMNLQGAGTAAFSSLISYTPQAISKLAMAAIPGLAYAYSDGAKVGADAAPVALPNPLTVFDWALYPNIFIRKTKYVPRQASKTELQQWTTL